MIRLPSTHPTAVYLRLVRSRIPTRLTGGLGSGWSPATGPLLIVTDSTPWMPWRLVAES